MADWNQSISLETGKSVPINLGDFEANLSKELGQWKLTEPEQQHRFVSEATELFLRPRLADRPLVFRANEPVVLGPGNSFTTYVRSAVWLTVWLEDICYLETPTIRPSDTWFGPPTSDGELCYAARTGLRLGLEEPNAPKNFAVTPLEVVNEAHESLTIAQLKIPAPELSTYIDDDSNLWTTSIVLKAKSEEFAEISAKSGAPRKDVELVSRPRATSASGLVRSFMSTVGLARNQ